MFIWVTRIMGTASLLLFLLFLYTGRFNFYDMGLSEKSALLWDCVLSIVFFVQHSVMIRKSFQKRLSAIVKPHTTQAVFTIVSSVVLTGVVICWQPSDIRLYQLTGFWWFAARAVFFLAVAGVAWGALALKSFDAFGVNSIRDHLHGSAPGKQEFTVTGPYRRVRHPLYFFVLLLIWSCPVLTLDRLLFNVLWSLWIYAGARFEERDLTEAFGRQYREYQKSTPMLIPLRFCSGEVLLRVPERKVVYSKPPEDPAAYTKRLDRAYSRCARLYDAAVKLLPFWKKWIKTVVPHIEGDRVLEASFGTGYLMTSYAGRYNTYGIDFNKQMTVTAKKNLIRKKVKAHLARASVEQLPFRSGSFDALICTMAFSGYPDGRGAMAEFYRVLKTGGKLLIVDFEYPADRNALGFMLTKAMEKAGDTIRNIGDIMERSGFEYRKEAVGGAGSVYLYVAVKKVHRNV